MELIKGDCLEELKKVKDKSVDFVYLDLPYGQTVCKWDKKLDLDKLWVQLKRVAKNDRTPFFFSCTTKFGFDLIQANKSWFRWDLVWEKNRAAGFLNAYKLPMRKHEMIYCFAKKTPEYDVSSHSEYLEETQPDRKEDELYGKIPNVTLKRHKDRLPTSVLPPTDDHELVYCFAKKTPEYDVSSHLTGKTSIGNSSSDVYIKQAQSRGNKEGYFDKGHIKKETKDPLPTSVLTPNLDKNGKSEHYDIDKTGKRNQGKKDQPRLPTSIIDQPSSWCKFNLDPRTGHRTAKPVALMEFLLKYWSKENDTILDPTMGSGSMGIACLNMNRKFIGIEKDEDIFKLAEKRIGKTEWEEDTS